MESHVSPKFKKWMKKCLNREFADVIDNDLSRGLNPFDMAHKIIKSREMTELMNVIRNSFIEQIDASKISQKNSSTLYSVTNSRPETSLSYVSDFSGDDWSLKGTTDEFGVIIDQMNYDKPDHVRLAGYEILLQNELTNISLNNSWDALLKTLREGLIDDSRSIFEASLLVHARLLNYPHFYDTFMSLLNAFAEQYHSQKLCDTLPSILSGVNFKIFLHEKLFRIVKLIIDHHEEILKGIRASDKSIEEMMEQFISFLCLHSDVNTGQIKPLNTLHIISIIEPQASWSRKWMHNLITRKILCAAISKSPGLIENVIKYVKRGLENIPTGVSVTISDEPLDVYISGDSVETLTFLHCLNLLTQLCSYSTGRALISEMQTEDSFSIPEFLKALLNFLNILATSEASNSVYESVQTALHELLKRPNVLYDARFYQVALNPLIQSKIKIWPHTLHVLHHMLDTMEGPIFLMTEYRVSSSSLKNQNYSNYPSVTILIYASDLLRQPIAVISIEHVINLFEFIEKLFNIYDIFDIVEEIIEEYFYPSITYMYSKLDKYYLENERKAQHLYKAVKKMLLNLVSFPLGIQMLSNEPLVFRELIQESIASVRASWSAFNVIGFISNSGFFNCGIDVILDLSSHVMSTLLIDLAKILEDPHQFHDPWENADIRVFLHVLALFSLNTNCFIAFMKNENRNNEKKENEYFRNLHELFQCFVNVDSLYHYLGLLSFKIILWNLDIYIYLLNLLDFQNKLLEFQGYAYLEHEDKLERNAAFIIDECSLLRHTILLNCYYVRHKRSEYSTVPEESQLFSELPPPEGIDDFVPEKYSQSELRRWLQENPQTLRDDNWISQTQKVHKASSEPIENFILLELLDQMEKATPAVKQLDRFKWNSNFQCNNDYWLSEENYGIDLVLHFGIINGLLKNNEQVKNNLKIFIQSTYDFLNYNKPINFQGFDWFLATIFLICSGNIDKSKTCVSQMLRFPTTMFIWSTLAQVVDKNCTEESSTKLLFAHLLENVISHEFPTIKFALKNECGLYWWMICDRLISQCFWGILPWSEIMHYFAICILYSPDYLIYYCVSLLNHCEVDIKKNIIKGKMWPENIIFEDYRYHSQIGFMDRLGKKYGGTVLPPLIQRKCFFHDKCN